jgi:hypothetical protein
VGCVRGWLGCVGGRDGRLAGQRGGCGRVRGGEQRARRLGRRGRDTPHVAAAQCAAEQHQRQYDQQAPHKQNPVFHEAAILFDDIVRPGARRAWSRAPASAFGPSLSDRRAKAILPHFGGSVNDLQTKGIRSQTQQPGLVWIDSNQARLFVWGFTLEALPAGHQVSR